MTRRAAAVSFDQSAKAVAGGHWWPPEFVGFDGKQGLLCNGHLAAFFVMVCRLQ